MPAPVKLPVTLRVEPQGGAGDEVRVHLVIGRCQAPHDMDHGHDCRCEPEVQPVRVEGGTVRFFFHDNSGVGKR